MADDDPRLQQLIALARQLMACPGTSRSTLAALC